MPVPLHPLRFHPIFRRYIWGGRQLENVLGKPISAGNDWAESWEICDRDRDQSVVEVGPLIGETLGHLVAARGEELLGRHSPQQRFPLLLKFLDAAQTLSVQVHPNDAQAAKLTPPDLGKTEVVVVMDTKPGSLIYAGLKPGIARRDLENAIRDGRCDDCLHSFEPSPGDCVFIPAGVVHAYGAGLLMAELQQASDVTYRLFDWNRLGPDGKPRPLHVVAGLDVVDFNRGPVHVQKPQPTDRPEVVRLVECDRFVIDRWRFDSPRPAGGDDRCHIIVVLQGAVRIQNDPANGDLSIGRTALLPACLGAVELQPAGETVLLDAYLP